MRVFSSLAFLSEEDGGQGPTHSYQSPPVPSMQSNGPRALERPVWLRSSQHQFTSHISAPPGHWDASNSAQSTGSYLDSPLTKPQFLHEKCYTCAAARADRGQEWDRHVTADGLSSSWGKNNRFSSESVQKSTHKNEVLLFSQAHCLFFRAARR